ncbi:hypothetical protein Hanom_Chr01g00035331 [Helianthus anomalus]
MFCGVQYPLSSFKMSLLKHYQVHFSQVRQGECILNLHVLLLVVHHLFVCLGGSKCTLTMAPSLSLYQKMLCGNKCVRIRPAFLTFMRRCWCWVVLVHFLSYLRGVIVDGVGDAKNFSFTHGNEDCEENPEVGSVPDSGTPLPEPPVHQVYEGSHNFPHVEDISNGEEEVEVHLPNKRKGEPVSVVGVQKLVPEGRNIRHRLRSASNRKE